MNNPINEYNEPELQTAKVTEPNERLTSSELADLWSLYMASTLRKCIVEYFLITVENQEIRELLENSRMLDQQSLKWLSEIYTREKHPIPHGFKEDEDVNMDAPRLFTDSFIISYLGNSSRTRMNGLNTGFTMVSRRDVYTQFAEFMADEIAFYTRILDVMKSNGMQVKPPYIQTPEKVDFISKKSFIQSYLGQNRPLTSIEVSHVFLGLEANAYRKALFTGCAQITDLERVREYLERGIEISSKHIEIFNSILIKNKLPVSMNSDSGVVKSNISPFSNRLILQEVAVSNILLFTAYGTGMSVLGTPSLGIDFMRLMAEIVKFNRDGWNILIDNGWAEEPPQVKGKETIESTLH